MRNIVIIFQRAVKIIDAKSIYVCCRLISTLQSVKLDKWVIEAFLMLLTAYQLVLNS
jgi:hypothetical protein